MPFATITRLPEQTLDGYRAVAAAARIAADHPEGLLLQLAGRCDEGVQIVSVWESAALHDRFVAERLHPALTRSGVGHDARLSQVEFEVDDLLVGAALAPPVRS